MTLAIVIITLATPTRGEPTHIAVLSLGILGKFFLISIMQTVKTWQCTCTVIYCPFHPFSSTQICKKALVNKNNIVFGFLYHLGLSGHAVCKTLTRFWLLYKAVENGSMVLRHACYTYYMYYSTVLILS